MLTCVDKTICRLAHVNIHKNNLTWQEVCIWCIENLGLPGNGYVTVADEDFMDFVFDTKATASFFMLTWGTVADVTTNR